MALSLPTFARSDQRPTGSCGRRLIINQSNIVRKDLKHALECSV